MCTKCARNAFAFFVICKFPVRSHSRARVRAAAGRSHRILNLAGLQPRQRHGPRTCRRRSATVPLCARAPHVQSCVRVLNTAEPSACGRAWAGSRRCSAGNLPCPLSSAQAASAIARLRLMLQSPAACSLPQLFYHGAGLAQAISRGWSPGAGLQGLALLSRSLPQLLPSCCSRPHSPRDPHTSCTHAERLHVPRSTPEGAASRAITSVHRRNEGASLEGNHLVHHLDGSWGGLWSRPRPSESREAYHLPTTAPLCAGPCPTRRKHASSMSPHPCWHPSTTARALALRRVPRGPQDHDVCRDPAAEIMPRSCREPAEILPRSCFLCAARMYRR